MRHLPKKTEWQLTTTRFVAFLDILGFKDMVMRKDHNEIYKNLHKISMDKILVEKAVDFEEISNEHGDVEVYIVSFSDSIVIFSKNDNINDFAYFLLATRWVFTGAFKEKIPLKGAIAHGKISLNKEEQIYFGQPIIDAYLLEEEVNYMGVVAHNSIDYYISNIKDPKDKEYFDEILFEGKTTLKCGNITHLNLNWFNIIREKEEKKPDFQNIKNKIEIFKLSSSGTARKYVENTLKMFIENRVDILKQSIH